MWAIERRLVQRVNQHALILTRSLYKNRIPDNEYIDLLTEIIETAIVDVIYQKAKYGDNSDLGNDDLLTAIRDIGMSVIDLRGMAPVRTMMELIHGNYNLTNLEVENRYFNLLDTIFEHFTSQRFEELVCSSVLRDMPAVIMDGIRDDICLMSFNINEPFIRMKYIYG